LTDQTITITLTDEEQTLIDTLTRERGLSDPAEALHALMRDAIAAYDKLWDETFAKSQDILDQLADEAHAEYLAGLTEDFDPDNDPDAP
jgi:hypothetical protein